MRLETVTVTDSRTRRGYRIINKSKFDADPDAYELYDADVPKPKTIEPDTPDGDPLEAYAVERGGGGTWKVFLGDELVEKGRGQAKLDAFLETLDAE